jgi:hypothetical protein
MEHTLFEKHGEVGEESWRCIDALSSQEGRSATHSTCGVNFSGKPRPHFAGNFWWARCEHIVQLPEPTLNCWTCGEMWVHDIVGEAQGKGQTDAEAFPSYLNLHSSGVDHYTERFPDSKWPPL